MKTADIQVGMLVTVSYHMSAQVFRVEKVNEDLDEVFLTYTSETGLKCNGGWVSSGALDKPKKEQIGNAIDEIDAWFDANPEYEGVECNAPVWGYYNQLLDLRASMR